MRRNGTTLPVPITLDLRGFQRRQPRAAIHWHLQQLGPGETLHLVLDPSTEHGNLLATLCGCGGEIVSAHCDTRARTLVVRRASLRALAEELDMRGARCPVPVIEARRRMRHMVCGEILKLRTDCTGAPAEVNAWTANSAQVLLLAQRHEGAGEHVFLIGRQ